MGSVGIVVIRVGAKQPMQMGFADHDHVVQQVPPDRPDDAFNISVLPRRSRGNRSVPDPHGVESFADDLAIRAITVS